MISAIFIRFGGPPADAFITSRSRAIACARSSLELLARKNLRITPTQRPTTDAKRGLALFEPKASSLRCLKELSVG
jgi:hypothetical protein